MNDTNDIEMRKMRIEIMEVKELNMEIKEMIRKQNGEDLEALEELLDDYGDDYGDDDDL